MKVEIKLGTRWWEAEGKSNSWTLPPHLCPTQIYKVILPFDLANICICERQQSLKATGKQDSFFSSRSGGSLNT